MTVWSVPRESVELVGPLTVTDQAGAPVTTFEVAVVPVRERPTVWTAPDLVGGKHYVLVGPGTARALAPGAYRIWVRHAASPETPVLDNVGGIVIT